MVAAAPNGLMLNVEVDKGADEATRAAVLAAPPTVRRQKDSDDVSFMYIHCLHLLSLNSCI